MSSCDGSPIGGYFELELPVRRFQPYPNALRLQSARAAFLALLQNGKPKRVWMPKLICDVMLEPLRVVDTEIVWYDLDDKWAVDKQVSIFPGDWLFYVNYYGVCKANIADLMRRFSWSQLVLDYSQSFFDQPEDVLATIFSPRKFFGLPDGGMLISKLTVPTPTVRDKGSLRRSSHLMRRIAVSPEAGYEEYRRAEESLNDCKPKQMSMLTERLFESIDFASAGAKRRENFLYLHGKLGRDNCFKFDIEGLVAPLCYPYLTNDRQLRQRLLENKVFVPTYWLDSVNRLGVDKAERMIANCLPLPIDQRYGIKHMDRIISIVGKGC